MRAVIFPPTDPPASTLMVRLDHLRHLRFHYIDCDVPQYILSHILAPPFLRVDVTIGHINESTSLADFPTDLNFDRHLPNLCRIRALSVSFQTSSNSFSITVTGESDRGILFALKCTANYGREGIQFIAAINNLARHSSHLAVEAIHFTDLAINHDPKLFLALFSKTLSNFPFTTTISFTSCTPTLPDALGIVSSVCPLLQFLRLENMRISERAVMLVRSRTQKQEGVTRLRRLDLVRCYGEVDRRLPQLRALVDVRIE